MKFRIRMLSTHRRQLRDRLSDTSREQACFLVCEPAQGRDETLLLVKEVMPLSTSDYRVHAPDQISVEPAAMLRAARRAQDFSGAVCMVHTHPMCEGWVEFSRADALGNQRTFEFFSRLLPGQPNSCLVFDGPLECVAGRVYTSATEWHPMAAVEVVSGDRRRVVPSKRSDAGPVMEQFERQIRLLGREGQQTLQWLCAGLVGCGGLGSLAAALLVHSGVRNFHLIDFDEVEASNLPRILGATPEDAKKKTLKTDVVRRYIHAHAPDAEVLCHAVPVETPALLSTLPSLDLIVCGTDDTTSRAFLNQLCHQYYVPVLDLGVQFTANPRTGQLVKEIGRVNLMLPGTPCLSCSGHIDARVLEQEGLSPIDRERQRADGHLVGGDVPEPAMMIFNMQVAGRGIQHLMGWITGLAAPPSDTFDSFRFLGLTAQAGIQPTRKRSQESCPFCGTTPSLLGAGDHQPILVAPRLQTAI